MSWSISASGSKAEALKYVHSQAENMSYKPGTLEGDDIVAAVGRIEKLVDAIAGDAVTISAYGSHSTTQDGPTSTSFTVTVNKAG